jgi:hypothetical protein
MVVAISADEAYVATVNIASELTSGRIKHGAKMSRNLRVSKASDSANSRGGLKNTRSPFKSLFKIESIGE